VLSIDSKWKRAAEDAAANSLFEKNCSIKAAQWLLPVRTLGFCYLCLWKSTS